MSRVLDSNSNNKSIYSFLVHVARVYAFSGPRDDLHHQRQTQVEMAINTVFDNTPADAMPFNGDVSEALAITLPVLEIVFRMSPTRPPEGSVEWVNDILKNPQKLTFRILSEYPKIFMKFLNNQLRHSDEFGRPRPRAGDDMNFSMSYKPVKKVKSPLLKGLGRCNLHARRLHTDISHLFAVWVTTKL